MRIRAYHSLLPIHGRMHTHPLFLSLSLIPYTHPPTHTQTHTHTHTLSPPHIQQDDCPTFSPGMNRDEVLKLAALAAKWKEPAKDALDTMVLSMWRDVGMWGSVCMLVLYTSETQIGTVAAIFHIKACAPHARTFLHMHPQLHTSTPIHLHTSTPPQLSPQMLHHWMNLINTKCWITCPLTPRSNVQSQRSKLLMARSSR